MHRNAPGLSRTVLVGVVAVWSVVCVTIGLFAMLVWPYCSLGLSPRVGMLSGLVLLMMGLFLSGMVADHLFPGADGRVTAVFELAPWAVLVGILVGFIGGWI